MADPGAAEGTTTTTPPDSGIPHPKPAPAGDAASVSAGGHAIPTASARPNWGLAVPIAVELGWTMAVLFGRLGTGLPQDSIHLPTEHELPESQRKELEIDRIDSLVLRLKPHLTAQSLTMIGTVAISNPPTRPELQTANFAILKALACTNRQIELAYQLGRSLRDTAHPPVAQDTLTPDQLEAALKAQLSHHRVEKLQEWMSTLSTNLAPNSAAIVGASVGRWSDFTATVLDDGPGSLRQWTRGDNSKAVVVQRMIGALLNQGDVWLDVLTGSETTTGLLTPEAYVAAGEAALSRTVRLIRRVFLHYWVAFLLLAVALGAVVWLAADNLGGAGKVWTQIAAIAGALGVSAKGIANGVVRMSGAAEQPIYQAEKLDAMAWAITTLPSVKLDNRGVRALRRSGIQRSRPLGPV
jgi:hypothetical protein